jgi:hypothetical protein
LRSANQLIEFEQHTDEDDTDGNQLNTTVKPG